jgi:uncharacterized C2H2 Zn-finger protein
MPSFECCGVRFKDGKELTLHVRQTHSIPTFTVELSCCNTSFSSARELVEHMLKVHHYQIKVST